jgi:hypothetical protein
VNLIRRWLRRRTAPREVWEVRFVCPMDEYARHKRRIIARGGSVLSAVRRGGADG